MQIAIAMKISVKKLSTFELLFSRQNRTFLLFNWEAIAVFLDFSQQFLNFCMITRVKIQIVFTLARSTESSRLKVSKSRNRIMASWILQKKGTLGQFYVLKIAPASPFFFFEIYWPLAEDTNVSSVVESQRLWVLKSKVFGQESTCHKGKIFKNSYE